MGNAEVLGTMASTDGLFVIASAPAGWYEVGEGSRRWFDGRQWTNYYAPAPVLAVDPCASETRHPINHGFHLIMIIMTLGVWMPVWGIVVAGDVLRSTIPTAKSIER